MLKIRREYWGLADCNNFFVSCERTVHPELEGRAVVVLSNNDGCIVARSNEAKALGIKMGQPAFEVRDYIRDGKLIAISGHHLLYREISHKVHSIFRRFVPHALDYSVDEAFLEMTGIPFETYREIGSEIVRACREEAKIPVTVGFAPSKTLAKIVTERAKKMRQPVGTLREAGDLDESMASMPVSELWGIGRRIARKLFDSGVYTIGDFIRRDPVWIRSSLGVNGERSWRELHGESCISLQHVEKTIQQSVSESRTFPKDIRDYDYVRARIVIYASDCARRLRAMHAVCRGVSVALRSNRFHTDMGYVRSDMTARFSCPTSDTNIITDAAIAALDRIFDTSVSYKRAGVVLCDIEPCGNITPSLFDDDLDLVENPLQPLMDAIDSINDSGTTPMVKLASQMVRGVPGHNDGYSSTFQYR